jgi:DNA-binding XRE family transcriptional regulator
MDNVITIQAFRLELGLTQEQFAAKIGLSNKGSVSVIERGGPCSLSVAIAIERLSGGRINAASLNPCVAASRASAIDYRSEPSAWADAIANSPNMRVEDHTQDRVIVCDVCDRRLGEDITNACIFVDCPHVQLADLAA